VVGFVLVTVTLVVAGVVWVVRVPLRIWHTTGSDGQMHPVTATWVAYAIGGGGDTGRDDDVEHSRREQGQPAAEAPEGPKPTATWRDRVSELTATGMSWEDATAQASAEGFPKGRWD
jgi:hypothetical protein